MDAEQIQTLRALLATQTKPRDAAQPKLARELSRLLAPRPALWTPVLVLGDSAAYAEPAQLVEDAPPLQSGIQPQPNDPVPPQILLGDLVPRRSAFGQRSDPVLELKEPAPPESRRLILLAADGTPVGEIVLHAGEIALQHAQTRRPFEAFHPEAPFFPEDLADDPQIRPRRVFGKAGPKAEPLPLSPPPRELAAAFLLANLAVRLAGEEEALRHRLLAVRTIATTD